MNSVCNTVYVTGKFKHVDCPSSVLMLFHSLQRKQYYDWNFCICFYVVKHVPCMLFAGEDPEFPVCGGGGGRGGGGGGVRWRGGLFR